MRTGIPISCWPGQRWGLGPLMSGDPFHQHGLTETPSASQRSHVRPRSLSSSSAPPVTSFSPRPLTLYNEGPSPTSQEG